MMGQTRLSSLIEATINIIIGLVINTGLNMLLLGLTVTQSAMLSVVYTLVSIARQYVIRRWFNAKLHAVSDRLAGDV